MRIVELLGDTTSNKELVVVYGGRFQPFHPGHFAVYNYLIKEFSKDSVWITTSDVTDYSSWQKYLDRTEKYKQRLDAYYEKLKQYQTKVLQGRKVKEPRKPVAPKQPTITSPFSFEEKKKIITTLFNVPSRKIVKAHNPTFSPTELLERFSQPVFVSVVSEKDVSRYKGMEKLPAGWDLKDLETADKTLYYYVVPMQSGGISATEIRTVLGDPNTTIEEKEVFFKRVYPRFDREVFYLMVSKLVLEE